MNATTNYDLVQLATEFSTLKHSGQVRRGTSLPYITHPIAVSRIVASVKTSHRQPELIAAALLHDTLEDTATSFDELVTQFGPLVASLVYELTNDEREVKTATSKLAYLKRKLVGMSSWALVIKLADRLHNVTDHPSPSTLAATRDLMVHLQQNRRLTLAQINLVNKIFRVLDET